MQRPTPPAVSPNRPSQRDRARADPALRLRTVFFIATGAGLALTVTTFTFARVSGALFNPAVSLGMALVGALGPLRALLLVVVQILGGILAAALVNALTPGSRNYTTTLGPTMTVARGLFLEMMLTMILMLTM